jgi:hypothetical protein
MTYYTAEARLLDERGWQAPPDLARAIVQREAFHAAIADLKHHQAATNQIATALMVADRDGMREAIIAHAVATFLDAECNRMESTFSDWGAQLSNTIAGRGCGQSGRHPGQPGRGRGSGQ